MGKKYIIELEDKPFHNGNGDFLYRVKGFNSLVFDMTGVGKLTPYTEPDLEQVRKEAYERGHENGYSIGYDEGREAGIQAGMCDAWEAARKVVALSTVDRREVFGSEYMYSILEKHTASECIEKIRQYEQGKEEIKVGDEVRNIQHGWTAVVSAIDRECMTLMDANGKLGDGYDMNRFIKTGRHFPEIAEVLQKMREDAPT